MDEISAELAPLDEQDRPLRNPQNLAGLERPADVPVEDLLELDKWRTLRAALQAKLQQLAEKP